MATKRTSTSKSSKLSDILPEKDTVDKDRAAKFGEDMKASKFGAFNVKKDDPKKDNAYYTKINSGKVIPIKKGDSLADVFAKIFNLLKYIQDEEKKRLDMEKNFKEGLDAEEERRHKKLIDAINGMSKSSASVVKQESGGGFFDFLKNMISNLKGIITDLLGTLAPIFDLLKTGLVKTLIQGAGWLLKALISPVGLVIGISAILGKMMADYFESEREKSILLRGGEAANVAEKKMMAADTTSGLEGISREDQSSVEAYGEDLAAKNAAIKEKTELVNRMMSEKGFSKRFDKTILGMRTNEKIYATPDGKKEADDKLLEEVSRQADEIIQKRRDAGETNRYMPTDLTPRTAVSVPKSGLANPQPATSPMTPRAAGGTGSQSFPLIPSPNDLSSPQSLMTPSLGTTPKVVSAINDNVNLNLTGMTNGRGAAPIVINKTNNSTTALKDSQGVVSGAADVRDSDLNSVIGNNLRRASFM